MFIRMYTFRDSILYQSGPRRRVTGMLVWLYPKAPGDWVCE